MSLTKENVYEVAFPKANLLPKGEGSLNHNVFTKTGFMTLDTLSQSNALPLAALPKSKYRLSYPAHSPQFFLKYGA